MYQHRYYQEYLALDGLNEHSVHCEGLRCSLSLLGKDPKEGVIQLLLLARHEATAISLYVPHTTSNLTIVESIVSSCAIC